jgi:hypothetical protein
VDFWAQSFKYLVAYKYRSDASDNTSLPMWRRTRSWFGNRMLRNSMYHYPAWKWQNKVLKRKQEILEQPVKVVYYKRFICTQTMAEIIILRNQKFNYRAYFPPWNSVLHQTNLLRTLASRSILIFHTHRKQPNADHWTSILSPFSVSRSSESGLWTLPTLQVPDLKTISVWLNKVKTRSVLIFE